MPRHVNPANHGYGPPCKKHPEHNDGPDGTCLRFKGTRNSIGNRPSQLIWGNCIRCKDARDVRAGHKKRSRFDPAPDARPRQPTPTKRQEEYRRWAEAEWDRILDWLDGWRAQNPKYKEQRWYPRCGPKLVNYDAKTEELKPTTEAELDRRMSECAVAFLKASEFVVAKPPHGVRAREKKR